MVVVSVVSVVSSVVSGEVPVVDVPVKVGVASVVGASVVGVSGERVGDWMVSLVLVAAVLPDSVACWESVVVGPELEPPEVESAESDSDPPGEGACVGEGVAGAADGAVLAPGAALPVVVSAVVVRDAAAAVSGSAVLSPPDAAMTTTVTTAATAAAKPVPTMTEGRNSRPMPPATAIVLPAAAPAALPPATTVAPTWAEHRHCRKRGQIPGGGAAEQ